MTSRFNRLWRLHVLVALLVSCSVEDGRNIEVYNVKRGEFVNSVIVTGQLEAVNSQVIIAPFLRWSMGMPKIAKIVDDGKRVGKGELLIQFDASQVQKAISDAKAELEIAEAELAKTRVNHASDMSDLSADLEIAKLSYKVSKLKLEKAEFEAEIDRKKIELDLEKASIQLEQARQDIENKKKVQYEEISKLVLKVQQARTRLDQAEQTLASLTVTAPSPGIAIIRESWVTDNKYQVDDQVHPGWPLINLPDLSSMKATVEISEVDISKLDLGQSAKVRADVYPDTSFRGHILEIATLARNKKRNSKVKVFDTTILLDENDEKLMPGMTVSCQIIVNRVPDTLLIPLEALFKKNGDNIVYVQNGSGFEPRKVKTGIESDNYVIVSEGLKEGDRIALVDPTVQIEQTTEKKTSPLEKKQ
ncbi:MAG TPA: efflux RND transporter periplasmic adaptor subunit [archaeon]|nr:efflux RND transporter periplasmic adaptor subunit [archaeon]